MIHLTSGPVQQLSSPAYSETGCDGLSDPWKARPYWSHLGLRASRLGGGG